MIGCSAAILAAWLVCRQDAGVTKRAAGHTLPHCRAWIDLAEPAIRPLQCPSHGCNVNLLLISSSESCAFASRWRVTMRVTLSRLSIPILLCAVLPTLAPSSLHGADSKEILRQARAAYYNVKDAGMAGFHCQVNPDWSFLEKIVNDDQGPEKILPVLRQVHFKVDVGANGDATVAPLEDVVSTASDDVKDRVKRTTDGFEQIITGFFQTWQGFLLNSPFPEAQDAYQLTDVGDHYQVTYRQDSTDIQIVMDHHFVIQEVDIKMPQVSVALRPQFSLEGTQLVLSGYEFENVLPSGEKQQGSVAIQNQKIEGLVLPARVAIKMMIGNDIAQPAFDFANYAVKKR